MIKALTITCTALGLGVFGPAQADELEGKLNRAANYVFLRDKCKAPEMLTPERKAAFATFIGIIQSHGLQPDFQLAMWRVEEAAKFLPLEDACKGMLSEYKGIVVE